MAAPIIPWQPSNIPQEIQNELNRRKVNRSFNFVNPTKVVKWGEDGEWKNYKGPMTAWVRMCSNSAGPLDEQGKSKKERFVLHGGRDFYTSYGYLKNASQGRQQIIGWTPGDSSGAQPVPHIIDTSKTAQYPTGVPNPEITKIEVTIQKELYRRANVEWVCFSWKQLEYMTPYFLIPRITILLEWGWNLFNPVSLVNIADKNEMAKLFNNPYPLYKDNILRSNGNYDVIYGFITNFWWSVEGNKIICNTEITSKDRLYAGITKDSALNLKSESEQGNAGCLQSVSQFLSNDDTIGNLIKLTTTPYGPKRTAMYDKMTNAQPLKEIIDDLAKLESEYEFYALEDPYSEEARTLQEILDLRRGYLSGIFYGRGRNDSSAEKAIGYRSEKTADFDKPGIDNKNVWINMGMVVEILNHFSRRKGVKNQPMFEVDINYCVIGGHPNLISCDRKVLIPNAKAPKYHYGLMGSEITGNKPEEKTARKKIVDEYEKQKVTPLDISSKADQKLYETFYQGNKGKKCYRNNISWIININRYIGLSEEPKDKTSYSFPSTEDKKFENGQVVKADFSGLLSNIYLSFEEFKRIVTDGNVKTYVDIYNEIFKTLGAASDGLWDLSLVENQKGKHTIVDRNYAAPANFEKKDGSETIYDFSYYDADSLIKSLKFRPQLSDAQATRAIYSSVNSPKADAHYSDKNDLLDYKYLDAVVLSQDDRNEASKDKENMREQLKNILRGIQKIIDSGDESLQMTVAVTTKEEKYKIKTTSPNSPGSWAPSQTVTTTHIRQVPDQFEVVKLVIPSSAQALLREIMDDGDYERNPRYCAIQPGINVELTLEGIGGIRTFQYFRIRNLPQPYSHLNIVFRVIDVTQTITGGVWETTIKAGILPLRKYIASQLGIDDVKFPEDTKKS